MSELKVYEELEDYVGYGNIPVEMYDRYEADKVILELKKEKAYVLENTTEVINSQEREIRLHKYKRCLAMAKWCFTRSNFFFVVGRNEGGRFAEERFRRSRLYSKWHKRWLKIAEQFKEVTNAR